ncbi:UDP-N-acetylmuramoyl-L-alanine--D-glutamate ligase [Martelella mediterranea]|uniref:UDP-N-acetylmuramoyl-L-alanine--D-glutamate ligase n=1 Tax=Martelella mediterranea TaxID=293089 RepID=UPI001E2E5CDC|nr:UDP-N-acetylmuramoyl-L-alanine--D-glutamate ligase [Martelella mediterranea]MCD1634921.1 UDP-N-acetylmuramoyl-L-alanine--D-glutamate ligase [Martelella mediterranea]
MIAVSQFSGKKVALFGLGGSGMATALALIAGGAQVTAFDDNAESCRIAAEKGIPIADLRHMDWSGFAALVLAPGVPLTHPKPHWVVELARTADTEIIGDVELLARERRATCPEAKLIAITGTNGKSTTTALIGHILKAAGRDVEVGGNIGRAVLDLAPLAPGRIYVVECSSYQIDLAPTLDADVGLLLNLTPDHLDRHGDMTRYAAIKERLVAGAKLAVVGADDDYCKAIADRLEKAGHDVVSISSDRAHITRGLAFDGGAIVSVEDGAVIADLSVHPVLRGAHNGQNTAAAIAACRAVGLTDDEIRDGLSTFPGLAHRMQPVARLGSVIFVNDSKATNAEASAPALKTFSDIHWIAGGRPKEGGIASLAPFFPKIARAYLIGEAAEAFSTTLAGAADTVICGTLENAVKQAADDAAKSRAETPVVLLSPACASFDQYRNFEKRGDAFVSAVMALDGIEPFTATGKEA